MSAPQETEILPGTNRLEKSLPLLDELCGSRAVPVEDAFASAEPVRHSVPPTGLPDSGDDSCWVARAVYGVDNPQWLRFREWMLGDAPAWFRKLYLRHGQRVARWITPHAGIKSLIRRWMDSVIAPK